MPNIIFSPRDVELLVRKEPLPLVESYRRKVEKHWNSANQDNRFFNGAVLAATRFDLEKSPPTIHLAMTDYAHYLYAASDRTHEVDCPALYCAVILLTSDRYILLGQMGAQTAAPGQIQCPGGGIELDTDLTLDARLCCQRELEEEVGEAIWSDRKWFRPLCIKTGGDLATIGLFYALRLRSDVATALQMFAAHQSALHASGEKPEFDDLHAVKCDASSLKAFLEIQQGPIVDYLRPLFLERAQEFIAALG